MRFCEGELCRGRVDLPYRHIRECECHYSCRLYGDCCRDSTFFTPGDSPYNFSCISLPGLYSSWKMIASCPAQSTEEEHRLCGTPNEMDPILSMIPISITSVDNSSLVYRNIYCARCNSVNPIHFKLWDAKFRCDGSVKGIAEIPSKDPTAVWNKTKKKWMYTEKGRIAECDMIYSEDLEETRLQRYRSCIPIVSTCPSEWWALGLAHLCKSYTALIMNGSITYKNPYCLMCNGGSPDNACRIGLGDKKVGGGYAHAHGWGDARFSPFPTSTRPSLRTGGVNTTQAPGYGGASFESDVYLNFFERGIDRLFRIDTQCLQSNVYDPLFNKCRKLLIRSPRHNEQARIDTCTATVLENDVFYVSADNATVFVPKYALNYTEGRFRLTIEGKLIICEDDIPHQAHSPYALVTGITTVVGLCLSIVFLLVHLCAVVLVSELRNLSGMNLASMCLALLGAYISFIAGGFLRSSELQGSCYVAAICTYYFFMAAFFWMFIIAFDVCRVLRASSRHLQVARGFKCRRFTMYAITAWGCSILLAVIAHLVETSPWCIDERLRPKFGSRNCWFGNPESLMIFFVIPLAIVMALNITFFLYAAAVTAENPSGQRKNLFIYFKLTVMLGLTWAVGLLASALNIEVLWIFFSFLNALQGLFIFVSFTLTPRVLQSLSKSFACCQNGCNTSKKQSPTTQCSSNTTINMILVSSTDNRLPLYAEHRTQ